MRSATSSKARNGLHTAERHLIVSNYARTQANRAVVSCCRSNTEFGFVGCHPGRTFQSDLTNVFRGSKVPAHSHVVRQTRPSVFHTAQCSETMLYYLVSVLPSGISDETHPASVPFLSERGKPRCTGVDDSRSFARLTILPRY